MTEQTPLQDEILRTDETNNVGGIAQDQLNSIVSRIERLEEEKANLSADIRNIYSESKHSGFDTKTIRAIIKLRKMDATDRDEQEYMLDLYKKAMNLWNQTSRLFIANSRLFRSDYGI